MQKTVLIFIHEIYNIIRQPAFWVITVVVPCVVLISGIFQNFRDQQVIPPSPSPMIAVEEIEGLFSPEEDTRPQGYVDLSGLLKDVDGNSDSNTVIGYTNTSDAQADLEAEKISAYYVIPDDYLDSMQIVAYTLNYNVMADQSGYAHIQALLASNILEDKVKHLEVVFSPLEGLEENNLTPASEITRDPDNFMTMLLPYMVMSFFSVSVLGTASVLLSSLSKEAENRVLEVLLNSATPYQILLGKITGLGMVGLAQVAIYSGIGLLSLRWGNEQSWLPEEYILNPRIMLWGISFFVFGYLLYAAIIAAVGALVPNLRETSQVSTFLTVPAMVPYFFIPILLNDPNGGVAMAFSLFPLTAPGVMMLRMSTTEAVPLWQVLLSLGLLIVTALLIIRVAARLFRAQTLLAGQNFQFKRVWRAVFRQV